MRAPRAWRSMGVRPDHGADGGIGGLAPAGSRRGGSWLPWSVAVLPISAVAWRLANRSWAYVPGDRASAAFASSPSSSSSAAGSDASGRRPAFNSLHRPPPAPTILGHRKVDEAPAADLVRVRDGRGLSAELLRTAAAESFEAMAQRARSEGVTLLAISGFRSIDEQQHVFFGIKSERAQTVSERAKVSAPPGYSEHHTGYAIDIGTNGLRHLEEEFERSDAFRWLVANAAEFHFELSFPRDNQQGIMYEPWHWRYVGNTHALETFA